MKFRLTRIMPLVLLGMSLINACSDDKEPQDAIVIKDEHGSVQLIIKNPDKWVAVAQKAAAELNADILEDVAEWENKLTTEVKQAAPHLAISKIIDECADEAEDVAEEKITNPYALFSTGDDCLANLLSIRNSLLGSLDGSVNPNSIMAVTAATKPELAQKVSTQLAAAAAAIQAIPQPLKQNATSAEAKAASAACMTLSTTLSTELLPLFAAMTDNATVLQPVVDDYVDVVVLPSLQNAKQAAAELTAAMIPLLSERNQDNIQIAIKAYTKARGAVDLCAAFIG